MSRQERSRELLGMSGSHQRYPDVESVRDLEAVSRPDTISDETKTPWREWVAENNVTAVAFGLLAAVGIALIVVFARRYVPLLVTNQWFQLGGLVLAIYIVGRRSGWHANQERVEEIDELSLQMGDYQESYSGTYIDGGQTKPPAFMPIKGFRKPGMRPAPYTVADVDPSVIERAEGDIDPDAAMVIRLHPQFTTATSTLTGEEAMMLTGGLEPAPNPEQWADGMAVLKATPPDLASPEDVREITETNERLADEKRELKKQNQEMAQRIRSLRKELNKPVDERLGDIIDRHKDLGDAYRGRRGTRRRDGTHTNGTATTPGPDEELEQVENEVSADD